MRHVGCLPPDFRRPKYAHCINSCSLWKNIGVYHTLASVKPLQFHFSWNIKNKSVFPPLTPPKKSNYLVELLCQIPDAQPYQVGNVSSLLSMTSDLVQFATDLSQGSARQLPLSLEFTWGVYDGLEVSCLQEHLMTTADSVTQTKLWQVLCDKVCNFLVALGFGIWLIWLLQVLRWVLVALKAPSARIVQNFWTPGHIESPEYQHPRALEDTNLWKMRKEWKRTQEYSQFMSILSKHMILSSYHILSYHIVSSIIHQPQPFLV